MLQCNRVCITSHFRDNGPQAYWGHDLDLSTSRDVIGHVTNRSAICHFLLVTHWNRVSIFNLFLDICIEIYLGHDLDLLGSRDVIGHVTNRSAIYHFLLVSHGNRVSIVNRIRDIRPPDTRTHRDKHTHADTRRKWFYILSHATYCIGQTITKFSTDSRKLLARPLIATIIWHLKNVFTQQ